MEDLKYLLAGGLILFGISRQMQLTRRLLRGEGRARLIALGVPCVIGLAFVTGTLAMGVFAYVDDERTIAERFDYRSEANAVSYHGFRCRRDNDINNRLETMRTADIPIVSDLNPRATYSKVDGTVNSKLPLADYLVTHGATVVLLSAFFVVKSLVAPAASGVVLAYTVYQYTEKGIIDVLPVIEFVLDLAIRDAHPNLPIIYAVIFVSFSIVTTHAALRSGSRDLSDPAA